MSVYQELQEEARQREQQQAKHIQEITDALRAATPQIVRVYRLCETLLLYIKLIPTINFLRERWASMTILSEDYAHSRTFHKRQATFFRVQPRL